MKNVFKTIMGSFATAKLKAAQWAGVIIIITIIMVIGLSFTACDEGDNNAYNEGSDNGTGIAPVITTAALPDGETGTAYSQVLTVEGSAPITWSVESGDLPVGLSLSENVISGIPTSEGKFDFTVKAVNAEGNDIKPLSITIVTYIPIPMPAGGFDTITEFKTWLDAQRANTAADPYIVKLNVDVLGGDSTTDGSVGNALYNNPTKSRKSIFKRKKT